FPRRRYGHADACRCRRSRAGGGRSRNRCASSRNTFVNINQLSTAVLLSGGLDSAVLLAEEAERGTVQPIYVSAGLAWEAAERASVATLLASGVVQHSRPLVTLTVDMHDVYTATHWAVAGTPPGFHTPDEDVYLPGRNIILLAKAGTY